MSEAEVEIRRRVVAEARSWVGTPFHHQGRVKGVGVDCLMHIREVGEQGKFMPRIKPRDDRQYWNFYGRRPNPPVMRECLARFLVPIAASDAKHGDIAWMDWRELGMPIHMAVRSELRRVPHIIHAIWDHQVVEHTFDDWHRAKVVEYWRYPAVAAAVGA